MYMVCSEHQQMLSGGGGGNAMTKTKLWNFIWSRAYAHHITNCKMLDADTRALARAIISRFTQKCQFHFGAAAAAATGGEREDGGWGRAKTATATLFIAIFIVVVAVVVARDQIYTRTHSNTRALPGINVCEHTISHFNLLAPRRL